MTTTGTAVVTLPSDTQILITREFDAPRHAVFRTWTTPELIKQWWAGDRGVTTLAEVDLRVGGAWRYVMTANAGFEVGFHGEFREVVPDERIVSTEIFEGFEEVPDAPGGAWPGAVSTTTFAEQDGRTTVTLLVQHSIREHRDLHVNSGMENGMQEAMDLLEQVAAGLD